ncbi:MAG: septum formation family protein [Herbiconiux sp.]|nr:septum formation family protein [Herbiconiux sp.]
MTLSPRPRRSTPLLLPVGLAALLVLTGCSFSIGGGGEASGGDGADTSVLELKVGDCLNDSQDDGTVNDVPVVDCAEPHDSEVFAVFDAEATGDTMPGEDELTAQANNGCDAAFTEFIGVPYTDSAYSYASYTPTLSSWYEEGGQAITCVAFDPAGPTTGSLEGVAE